jgi:aminoglycoside phosphotransferase (APT) family kinase protein
MSARSHPNYRVLSTLPRELRRTAVPPHVRLWVERAVGARVVRVRRLPGASSTAVHRLHLAHGTSLVLRRYAWPGFLEDEPIAPRRELDALVFAAGRGLPVPQVVAADITGEEIGDGIPAILMSFVPGQALAVPDPRRLAEVVVAIHDTEPAGFGHDYFPWFDEVTFRPPAASRQPKPWERALALRDTVTPSYRPTLIHRDFHPGNLLWLRGRCSGVVDWANACRGPAGCDVATCRANLIELGGLEAANRFRDAYEALTGERHHPYWDLLWVLEHDPSTWTPQELIAHELRLSYAVKALDSGG